MVLILKMWTLRLRKVKGLGGTKQSGEVNQDLCPLVVRAELSCIPFLLP
jgi:hypothetical protein